MRSPLLLIPVVLNQENLSAPIVLSRYDEEIMVNNALEQKLQNDFGIILPLYDESGDWQTYLSQVQEVCVELNWNIESNVTQLSLFSF